MAQLPRRCNAFGGTRAKGHPKRRGLCDELLGVGGFAPNSASASAGDSLAPALLLSLPNRQFSEFVRTSFREWLGALVSVSILTSRASTPNPLSARELDLLKKNS